MKQQSHSDIKIHKQNKGTKHIEAYNSQNPKCTAILFEKEIPIPENFNVDCLDVVVLKTHRIKNCGLI